MPNDTDDLEKITTKIWHEEPEPDNPFAAKACYCSGYDVYGELLGKASYIEYLYLLFQLERPSPADAKTLEILAVALANPGPRDHSVRAAMNAGVGGSTRASMLMAALGVGAGNLGGGREVYTVVEHWEACGTDTKAWQKIISDPPKRERADIWPEFEHIPGFDPQGVNCRTPILRTLDKLIETSDQNHRLVWLKDNRQKLEEWADAPLSMSGLAGATLSCLGFTKEQAEILYLLIRLPGAAAHALEQEQRGVARYPFFPNGIVLKNDPGPVPD
ncbi:MAG: citryl-CoA lyase [bacterium]